MGHVALVAALEAVVVDLLGSVELSLRTLPISGPQRCTENRAGKEASGPVTLLRFCKCLLRVKQRPLTLAEEVLDVSKLQLIAVTIKRVRLKSVELGSR